MKFLKATLDGYLSFRYKTEIPFEGLSMVALTGANGDGKSAAMSSIPWILFGDSRVGKDRDSVVNEHMDSAHGTLDMEDSSGTRWRVNRSKFWQGAQKLDVHHWDESEGGWVRFSDHRIDSAQDKIFEIMGGLNVDSFYSLCMMKQEAGSRFVKASSDERIAIFMSLLPELEDWSYYEATAAERLREVNRKIDQLDSQIDQLDSSESAREKSLDALKSDLNELDSREEIESQVEELVQKAQGLRSAIESSSSGRSDLSEKLKTLQAQRRAHNAELENKRTDLKNQLRNSLDIQKRISRGEDKIDSLKLRKKEIKKDLVLIQEDMDEIESELKRFDESMPDYQVELETARKRESLAESTLEEIKAQIDALEIQHEHEDKGRCILCDSELSSDKLQELIDKANTSLQEKTSELEEILTAKETAKTAVDRLTAKIKRSKKDRTDAVTDQQKNNSELESIDNQLVDLNETIDELDIELKKYPSNESLEERIELLVDDPETEDEVDLRQKIDLIDSENPLVEELSQTEKRISRRQLSLQELSRIGGKIESEQESLESIKKTKIDVRLELAKLNQDRESLEWTKKACSQKGVPSMLIGEILGQIEERQNQLLERLMGERAVKVEFKQQRELKTREGHKDVLDIIVHTPEGWTRPIESFSGGEQVRLTFSNIFAMIQVFNERRPGLIDDLFLDEPLGPLDVERTPIVLDIIRDALSQGIVQSVFMSTHDQIVIDAMPQRMIVTRDPSRDNTSMVEIV